MSKYTTEVRFICENANGLDHSEGYGNIEDIMGNFSGYKIGLNYQ